MLRGAQLQPDPVSAMWQPFHEQHSAQHAAQQQHTRSTDGGACSTARASLGPCWARGPWSRSTAAGRPGCSQGCAWRCRRPLPHRQLQLRQRSRSPCLLVWILQVGRSQLAVAWHRHPAITSSSCSTLLHVQSSLILNLLLMDIEIFVNQQVLREVTCRDQCECIMAVCAVLLSFSGAWPGSAGV